MTTRDLVHGSRFHIALPHEMKRGLLELATERGISAAAVARTAIREHLEREGIEAVGTAGAVCKHPLSARQRVGTKEICGLCLDEV